MDGEKIVSLVNLFGVFHTETGGDDLAAFSTWLNRRLSQPVTPGPGPAEENRMLVWLVHRLSKVFRWYAKDTLHRNGLTSMDEYFFLVAIRKLGLPSKTELYAETITEINTGTQMMKRMIEAGLIEEVTDKKDKRVRRVRLTPKGKRTRERFFEDSVADLKLKAGNLSATEKKELIRLLAYLEKFHTGIYSANEDLSFTELAEKHLLKTR